MEFDVLEVLLRHAQHIAAVGEEDIATFAVLGHVLVFASLEILQLLLIVRLYPARFVKMDGLPTALRVVFVLQTVLDDLELQLAHRPDDFATVELVDEQLGYTLVHQLRDTFLQVSP